MPNLPWYIYLIMVAGAIIYLLMNPAVRKFFLIFTHKSFTKNPKGTTLNADQQKAISVGLINGEQVMSYIDSLATGLEAENLRGGLADAWGVSNNATAHAVLESLLNVGHRVYFDTIVPLLGKSNDMNQFMNELQQQNSPDDGRLVQFGANLVQCMQDFKEDPDFPYTPQNMQYGVLAWDAGRVVTVARMAYDMKYLSENEAWEYIMTAYDLVKKEYKDWNSFAISYVVGRGMWGGNNMSYAGIIGIAKEATTDAASPWVITPLK